MRHAPWLLSVLGATLVFALAGCGDGNSANTAGGTQRYVVVSGGTSGVYYPTATAITRLAGRVDPNLVIDVQTSGGSVANARKLGQGNAHLAMMQNDIAAYARSGQEMFDEPIDTIVGVAALYPEHIQLVAHADSGVRRIADLRGKRVAIGDIGSGTEANARQILRAHGLSVDDLGKVERLTATESRQYLQDRRIDVAFFTFGVGTAAIQDLARNSDIRLVPIDGVQRRTLIDQYGFYRAAVVPAGAYEGLDTDVPTVSVMATLVARRQTPDAVIESVLDGIFENRDEFRSTHARLRRVNRVDAAQMTMPLHPAAAAFYGDGATDPNR